MTRQVIQRISNPEASIESLQEQCSWLWCGRTYIWQPIYQTYGRLMVAELLTVVTYLLNPPQRLPPGRYFTEVTVSHRVEVVKGQIDLLVQRTDFFVEHDLLASVNIDGPTFITLRQQPRILRQVGRLSWLRFEPVEYIRLSKGLTFVSVYEFGPSWPDDFGTGMADFSALSEVRCDYVKTVRELFVMLRQLPERRALFSQLSHLMNCYCRRAIAEDVKTLEGWRDVQNSSASAAQSWFPPRPAPIETLNTVVLTL